MEYTIYKASLDDLNHIMDIIKDAKVLLKQSGSTQWNNSNNYPDDQTFTSDILAGNCYVYFTDNKVCGVITIELHDDSYNVIDGKWIKEDAMYGVIHRLAVKKEYHNKKIGDTLISFAIDFCKNKKLDSIRIDTHKLNIPIQKIATRNGFIYCGIITLLRTNEDNKRFAYEKVLDL